MNIWKRASLRKIAVFIIIAALFITGAVILGDEAINNLDAITTWSKEHWLWSLLLFVLLYSVLHSLFFPDTLLGIFAGIIFGFSYGVVGVVCASLLAAALQYLLAHHLLKPAVNAFLDAKPTLQTIQKAVLKDELKLQALIRLTPLNRAITSYMLGASGVQFKSFMLACLATVPILSLEVYFGYAGKQLVKTSEQSGNAEIVQNTVMIAGLMMAIVVMVLVTRIARRALDAATAEANKAATL